MTDFPVEKPGFCTGVLVVHWPMPVIGVLPGEIVAANAPYGLA